MNRGFAMMLISPDTGKMTGCGKEAVGRVDVITYDLDTIEHAQQGLARLAGDYRAAGDDLDHVEQALGSPEVARAIVDFTDDWKRRRDKQVEMIEAAEQALATIRETYVEIDTEGARTLRQANP